MLSFIEMLMARPLGNYIFSDMYFLNKSLKRPGKHVAETSPVLQVFS